MLTQWTLAPASGIPVPTNTSLAEVVSTWNGDWLSEHIQTDGALELIFRQETARGRHFCNTKSKSNHIIMFWKEYNHNSVSFYPDEEEFKKMMGSERIYFTLTNSI
jgi:hypothetical protein